MRTLAKRVGSGLGEGVIFESSGTHDHFGPHELNALCRQNLGLVAFLPNRVAYTACEWPTALYPVSWF